MVSQKPTSTLSQQARLNLVDGLLGTITSTYDAKSGLFTGVDLSESAHIIHALSSFDYFSGSTTNQELVMNSLDTVFTSSPSIISLDPSSNQLVGSAIDWGLAAMNVYRAYKNESVLIYAEEMYRQGTAYMITPEDATAGAFVNKSSIQGTCNGVSNAGGVFWTVSPDNTAVVGETVGALFVLSARLYQHTNDAHYLETMELTLNFLTHQLYNGNIIMDGITLATCEVSNQIVTQNSGWAIDGLTTVVAMNDTWEPFLSNLVSTVIPNPAWTNVTDGIITEGPTNATDASTSNVLFPLKGIYIRGLYERYRAIPADSNEAALIRSHITVQFNALLDLASVPGSNYYSPRWQGPPPQKSLPYGQLSAADVLIAAAGFPPDVDSPASSSPSPPTMTSASQSHSHRVSAGAIAGIVIGVVFCSLIVAVSILVLIRRRKSRSLDTKPLPGLDSDYPSTATYTMPAADPEMRQAPHPRHDEVSLYPDSEAGTAAISEGGRSSMWGQRPRITDMAAEFSAISARLHRLISLAEEAPPPRYDEQL